MIGDPIVRAALNVALCKCVALVAQIACKVEPTTPAPTAAVTLQQFSAAAPRAPALLGAALGAVAFALARQ